VELHVCDHAADPLIRPAIANKTETSRARYREILFKLHIT
jgi:hypothetical protein